MTLLTHDPAVEIFKALSESVRLQIMGRIASVEELPCTTLEQQLPISRSTLSYHMKILYRARLVDIRKDGRYYYYRARTADVERILPGMLEWLVEYGKTAVPAETSPAPESPLPTPR